MSVEQYSAPEPRLRLVAVVTGIVQGVNFRWFANRQANSLGIVGYARNCGDGSVQVVAEGTRPQLNTLLELLRQGPPSAVVDNVEETYSPARNEFFDFRILY